MGSIDPRAGRPQAMRLLVVDDEDTVRISLRDYFESIGWLVDVAAEVDCACELLRTRTYDAVLADLYVGVSRHNDGLEVIRAARLLTPPPRTVVLTGFASPTNEALARSLGIDAFLSKPQPLSWLATVLTGEGNDAP